MKVEVPEIFSEFAGGGAGLRIALKAAVDDSGEFLWSVGAKIREG